MPVTRFIPGYPIATSPMPYYNELEHLAKHFKAVLIVVEPHELEYDPNEWEKLGVDFLHIPVRDFTAPHLLDLYRGVRWIDRFVKRGQKVLIHCYGGLGRSGTFAAAYLIYRGLNWTEAITRVRRVVYRAIEIQEQIQILRTFDMLMKALPEPKISVVFDFGAKYNFGKGLPHASKVTQLAIELWDGFSNYLNLPRFSLASLAVAGILHDIGRKLDDLNYHIESYRVISSSNELKKVLGEEITKTASLAVLYHQIEFKTRKRDSEVSENLVDLAMKLAGIIRIADGLDSSLNQSIKNLRIEKTRNSFTIGVIPDSIKPYKIDIAQANEKKFLLEKILKKTIHIVPRFYYEF